MCRKQSDIQEIVALHTIVLAKYSPYYNGKIYAETPRDQAEPVSLLFTIERHSESLTCQQKSRHRVDQACLARDSHWAQCQNLEATSAIHPES